MLCSSIRYQTTRRYIPEYSTVHGYYLSIYLSIYSIYGSTALFLDLGRFFSFLIFYTVGRTPWTGDQPVARPLPAHRTAQTRKKAHKHPFVKWDSNPGSQCLSGRRQFMLQNARLLWWRFMWEFQIETLCRNRSLNFIINEITIL
jgi:hypothetical protein